MLYGSEIGNNIVPYFDLDEYELTNVYLFEVLEIACYDRSVDGRGMVGMGGRMEGGRGL